jgi:hypothetical protein
MKRIVKRKKEGGDCKVDKKNENLISMYCSRGKRYMYRRRNIEIEEENESD